MKRPILFTVWLFLVGAVSGVAFPLASVASDETIPITSVETDLAHLHKWDQSNGDTWDPFWAEDDNCYAFNCDGSGFGRGGRNMAFNKLEGRELTLLQGSMVNEMTTYGKADEKGPDNATWKALGQECIDSVFYSFVSRQVYGKDSGDPLLRQTSGNASLIKSTDLGKTWTRDATENYLHPMWPGRRFGAPFFIHYGKNGGNYQYDGANRYAYAVSNNGYWCDGDNIILARVERNKLANLNAGDWSYYTGGDGMDDSNWSPELARAQIVFDAPTHCGTSAPSFIPALNRYLMVVWYNPQRLRGWYSPIEVVYEYYEAPHPWGPWNKIGEQSDRFLERGNWYGPNLAARFQEKTADGVRVAMFTSGCPFESASTGLYKMWEVPLLLRTTPRENATTVASDDASVVYHGDWTLTTRVKNKSLSHRVEFADGQDDRASFNFSGTGIDYVAEMSMEGGEVEVQLDHEDPIKISLKKPSITRLSGVTVFGKRNMPAGQHTLSIAAANGSGPINVQEFVVYGR